MVHGHEGGGTAVGTLTSQTGDLVVLVDLVVLEDRELDLLSLVLLLLGLGVGLLLSLLTTTAETEDEVKGGLLLDVVVGESTAILELLSSEDETLLIRGDSFLVLDLLLDVLDGVTRVDIKGDGLARKGLDENLHARHLCGTRRKKGKRERERERERNNKIGNRNVRLQYGEVACPHRIEGRKKRVRERKNERKWT